MLLNDDKRNNALDEQDRYLDHLFRERMYTRSDIMRIVYNSIFGESYSTDKMITDYTANHWEKVVYFLQTILGINMSIYKKGNAFRIPLADAVSICTYAYMLLKSGTKRRDSFIAKLIKKDIRSITPSEWKCYNKNICKFLEMLLKDEIERESDWQRKCTRKIACSDECDKYDTCEKILSIRKCLQYVEQMLDDLSKIRNDIIQSRSKVENQLGAYLNTLQSKADVLSAYCQKINLSEDYYKPTLDTLVFRYKESLYNFINASFEEITTFIKEIRGTWKCESHYPVDLKNNVCCVEFKQTKLTIYEAESFEDIKYPLQSLKDFGEMLNVQVSDFYETLLRILNAWCLLNPGYSPCKDALYDVPPHLKEEYERLILLLQPPFTPENMEKKSKDINVFLDSDTVIMEIFKYYPELFQNSYEYAVKGLSKKYNEQIKKLKHSCNKI